MAKHNSSEEMMLKDAMCLPHVEDGQSIGLFGGSFNPPHQGHLHVSKTALIRAQLDQVWWLVSPGNPLKDHSELSSLSDRVRMSRKLIDHPRIKVSAIEAKYNETYTEKTLSLILRMRPKVNFVWLMGADNLAGFHRWQNWQKIASMVPIMVIDRPGSTLSFRSARAAISLARYRIDETDAELLPGIKPPAWTFVHAPRSPLSSTEIRNMKK